MQGSGCRVQDAGFRIQGSGFRVQDLGCSIEGSYFRFSWPVWGLRVEG